MWASAKRQHGLVTSSSSSRTGVKYLYRTIQQLIAKGAKVYVASRDAAKSAAAVADLKAAQPNAQLEVLQLDLADLPAVKRAAEELLRSVSFRSINLLRLEDSGFWGVSARRVRLISCSAMRERDSSSRVVLVDRHRVYSSEASWPLPSTNSQHKATTFNGEL